MRFQTHRSCRYRPPICLRSKRGADETGSCFTFLIRTITRQTPFQVLCLKQLKMLGSFGQKVVQKVSSLATEPSIIVTLQVKDKKGPCEEQKHSVAYCL